MLENSNQGGLQCQVGRQTHGARLSSNSLLVPTHLHSCEA